jgi:hypothetical protein
MTYPLAMLGRWDEALARMAEIPDDRLNAGTPVSSVINGVMELLLHRGLLADARELFSRFVELEHSDEVQMQGGFHAGVAALRLAEGKPDAALSASERAIATRYADGIASQGPKLGLIHAFEAAHALGQPGKVDELLAHVDELPRGLRPPLLEATAHRFRARLAGDAPEADRLFAAAAVGFAAIDVVFDEAVVQLEHGEWLTARGRPEDAQPLLAEARDTFERLQAQPWVDRVDVVAPGAAAEVIA